MVAALVISHHRPPDSLAHSAMASIKAPDLKRVARHTRPTSVGLVLLDRE